MPTSQKKPSLTFSLPSSAYLNSLSPLKKTEEIKFAASSQGTILVTRSGLIKELKKDLEEILLPYQLRNFPTEGGKFKIFETKKGPLALVIGEEERSEALDHEGLLDTSSYASTRDLVGEAYKKLEVQSLKAIHLHAYQLKYDELLGAFLGIEIAHYDYKGKAPKLKLSGSYSGELPEKALKDALLNSSHIGHALNIARFLVDTPPSKKRPQDYATSVQRFFSKKYGMSVEVWGPKKLKSENMGCLFAVGEASPQQSHLVHLRYRPKMTKDEEKKSPVALIGKGITFDTGGLDLKPASAMRLMKKDMGGSASLVGLAYWLSASKIKVPCDIYLPMAENAIGPHSFRPGDILTARNGMKVEIDNTDAEGRLAMADALSLASEAKGDDKPQCLIDVSTLTGAIKVGLGPDVAGLFSNSDDLAFILQSCSQIAGDFVWRMPLLKSQRKLLESPFADVVNSASGFGGAIRAAMFLKEFTGGLPWAHLDIFSWSNGQGAYRHSGGSGQCVQLLAQFISQL